MEFVSFPKIELLGVDLIEHVFIKFSLINNFFSMLDNIMAKVNLDDKSFYVLIFIFASIFSTISLVFNPVFIFYGLITVAYSIIAQIWQLTFQCCIKNKYWILFLIHFILVGLLIYASLKL